MLITSWNLFCNQTSPFPSLQSTNPSLTKSLSFTCTAVSPTTPHSSHPPPPIFHPLGNIRLFEEGTPNHRHHIRCINPWQVTTNPFYHPCSPILLFPTLLFFFSSCFFLLFASTVTFSLLLPPPYSCPRCPSPLLCLSSAHYIIHRHAMSSVISFFCRLWW